MIRRPSPALVVALIALFVALGGPAQAKKLLVGSKQIKDRSIAAKDLRKSLIKNLQLTSDGSITATKLADGARAGDRRTLADGRGRRPTEAGRRRRHAARPIGNGDPGRQGHRRASPAP